MVYLWFTLALLLVYLWCTYGLLMLYVWFTYGLLGFSYGVLMVYNMDFGFTYGLPRVYFGFTFIGFT